MANDIGLRKTDAEHVGFFALSQLLTLQGCNGHVSGDVTGQRIETHILTYLLELLILDEFLVVILGPLRKFLHIVGAGNELAVLPVEPVGTVGRMTGRKDSGTVLIADTDDLRTEVCVQT